MQPTVIEHTTVGPLPEPLPAFNPLSIIDKAVERGATPESLQKLLDLLKDWTAFQAQQQFNAAMAKCQAEMPAVLRTKRNDHTENMYALLENLQYTTKPVYTKHGFALSWTERESNKEGLRLVVLQIQHSAGCNKEVMGYYPIDGVGAKGGKVMNALQGTVSCHSYAQRDLMRLAFNIVMAGMDNDGISGGGVIGGPEIAEFNALWEECEKAGKIKDFARFLHWLGVENLEQLTYPGFTKAMAELNRKRRNGGGK